MRGCWRSASTRSRKAVLVAALLTWLSVGVVACRREAGWRTGDERAAQPITVCELLKNLASYRGKMVAVRGIYYYGLREPKCADELTTGGHRWPAAINLIGSPSPAPKPGALDFTGEEAVEFATDWTSWEKWGAVLLEQSRAGLRGEIWITVHGKVRARDRYVRPDGTVSPGYGHLGAFPAEIVVKRILDVQVKTDPPTYDYSVLLKYPAL